MSWLGRVEANICHLSVNSDNVTKALKEWYYTGDTIDLERPIADCELCDHPNIRYQFVICNDNTDNELLIGSECITKFGISAVDASGARLSERETKQKVGSDRNKLISDAKKRSVINSLVELAGKEEEGYIDIDDLIDYLQERGAFTPKQLNFLMWRLGEHGINHTKTHFKMIIRRDREKQQLLNLEDWQVEQLWPCMSQSQREWYSQRRG